MAFNNRNNNRTKVNTTTNIAQLYNDQSGDDSSTLKLSFWNDYATISINPMLPKSEQVDGKMYNYEKTASTLLNVENLIQLQRGIKLLEKEEKLGDTRKIFSVAIKASNNIVMKVGCSGEYDGIDSHYIALFSLNEDGGVDGNAFYIFNKPEVGLIVNFDEENPTIKSRKIDCQWEEFKKFIDLAADTLINGSSHGSSKFANIQFAKLGTLCETIKSLVENILSGNSGPSSKSSSGSGFNGNSGFVGSRKRRSSVTLSAEDIDVDDDDSTDDEEIDFDSSSKKSSTKTTKKKTTAKKTSAKKISVNDIASDMEDDIDDDMGDLD